MTVNSPAKLPIYLSQPQIGSILAVIQIHRDGVRAKLQNDVLHAEERSVLQHLELQLESTRQIIERALAEADFPVSGSAG